MSFWEHFDVIWEAFGVILGGFGETWEVSGAPLGAKAALECSRGRLT